MTATDESWTSWLCDLEAEDYTNLMNESDPVAPAAEKENLQQSFSPNSYSNGTFKSEHSCTMSNSSGDDNNSFDANTLPQMKDSSHSFMLSFDNVNPTPPLLTNVPSNAKPKCTKPMNQKKGSLQNQKKEPKANNIQDHNKNSASITRSPHQNQDHIIAERKRREKISQQFIALSALIPGLKKMDKASVLGDAISHVKELQEQVKVLEEQNKRKRVESVVYVEKARVCAEEDVSDASSNSGDGNIYEASKTTGSLPEVEARVSDKNVMVRIHCQKQKGVYMNILKEMENLHLSIINSSAVHFGTSKLDITIVAEMDDEFSVSVKELARNIREGVLQLQLQLK